MSVTLTLQGTFESEYPLLDSSLLAAFISELPSEADRSHESLETLRHTLAQLSLEAQNEPRTSDVPRTHDHSVLGSDEFAGSQNSNSTGTLEAMSPLASGASSTSTCATSASSEPALDFLHTLFPRLSKAIITQTSQESHDTPSDDSDLSAIVDHLLNLEYVQELAERGLDDEVDVGDGYAVLAHKRRRNGKRKTKSRAYKYTIPLIDIRQRQHAPHVLNAGSVSLTSSISTDPWTRLESLATRVSEVLKPTPRGFFMSYFHAPAVDAPYGETKWKSEGDALRKALSVLAKRVNTMNTSVGEDIVEAVCDVVLDPEAHDVAELDVEQRERLVADARLCATAARGDPSTAIDLVWMLRELDDAFIRGEGVAHAAKDTAVETDNNSRAQLTCSTTRSRVRPPALMPPSHPPPAPPPPLLQKYSRQPSNHANSGWTFVGPRPPAEKLPHSHTEFIPAYTRHTPYTRQHLKGAANQFGKGAKNDVGELQVHSMAWYKARAHEFQSQRTEMLHEATRHWKSGNAKSHGGEVATYYAEKARELQERQRKLALDAARKMVEEKRSTSTELDLHGLTVTEACIIVTEIIARTPPSSERPLKIITGRGRHSVGGVGVLGPAVHEMLHSAGWRVGTWDGGLIVCGRV